MRSIALDIYLSSLIFFGGCQPSTKKNSYDVIIYGATSAGIAAAIQASQMGKQVLLLEPGTRVGGLTTGGLGQTDIGNKAAIGGISRDFYESIKTYYDDSDSWKWPRREDDLDGGQTRAEEGESSMWTFEPSAALKVYEIMISLENVDLKLNRKRDRRNGVQKMGAGSVGSDRSLSGDRGWRGSAGSGLPSIEGKTRAGQAAIGLEVLGK